MPLHPPKIITKLRSLKSGKGNSNSYSSYNPISMSVPVENDVAGGDLTAPPYNETWVGTHNHNTSEFDSGGSSTLLGEPSPVDWEQW
jgi:hypothetical protein